MNFIEKTIAKKVISNLAKNLPKIEQSLLDKIPDLQERYQIMDDEDPIILIKPMKDAKTKKLRLVLFLAVQMKDHPDANIEILEKAFTSYDLLKVIEGIDIENLNIPL
jgi:hypothetical protein